jgi:hypothetical protein
LDIDEDTLKSETMQDKQEEIEMLQEFDRRRKFKSAYDAITDVENEAENLKNSKRLKPKEKEYDMKKEKEENNEAFLEADPEQGELWDYR